MKKRIVTMDVNGTGQELLVAHHRTLLEVLREDLNLPGTKYGCEMGECGACTVLVDGTPTLSCLTLASLCEGKSVTTVEGLDGRLARIVERAFAEEGGSQCGYCTPGMVVMFNHLLAQPRPVDVREELSGNICRCTGYTQIINAFERGLELADE